MIHRTNPQPQWSDAVTHDGTAYFVEVPESGDTSGAQALAVFTQAERTLSLCGSDKSRLLMATIYLKHMRDRAAFNAVWEQWVAPGNAPPRATVQAKLAKPEWKVEMVVTAAL